jgi:phosphoribosylformimino-5-aminoimidazole carboxamide ribotide isomerase
MIVIPAVDLKDGKCVRLVQGDMDRETVFSEDPVEMARRWEAKGAKRLHVVDLNGAVTGKPCHGALVREIARAIRVPVEIGGGIRDLQTIEDYLSSGVQWVILGTIAFQKPELVKEAVERFPGRVILSLDARGGRVAVQGWKETVSLGMDEMMRRFEGMGLAAVIFTDVERDGMGTGLNWESTKVLAQLTDVPVIASGGISRLEEIERLKALESLGVVGVIIGRSLYTGAIDLEEAIRTARS